MEVFFLLPFKIWRNRDPLLSELRSGPPFWWIISIIMGNLKHKLYRLHPDLEDLWWSPGIPTSVSPPSSPRIIVLGSRVNVLLIFWIFNPYKGVWYKASAQWKAQRKYPVSSVKWILNKSPLSPMSDGIDSGVIQVDHSEDGLFG